MHPPLARAPIDTTKIGARGRAVQRSEVDCRVAQYRMRNTVWRAAVAGLTEAPQSARVAQAMDDRLAIVKANAQRTAKSYKRAAHQPTAAQHATAHSEVVSKASQKNRRATDMNFIIYIVVGGIAGWLASLIMRTDAQQGLFLNIVVGIVGGLIGGLILPMLGLALGGWIGFLITALIGAVILLAIVNMVRRGSAR